ncbi:hypothetical protein [Psychrobacillus sp. FJAT-21963]|uniref:hypothetical protein n=1 Tax=Psychrobacillus sp. FJAT-21963 TaxID=1712028 RepID=UPI0006F44CA6|nr:hypothetical protein [Psychrobacillus sp. FJAT-21963]KQL32474.1 hypothetical protein AN959_19650 [Psychrobacillus sp. FJAT-21963]
MRKISVIIGATSSLVLFFYIMYFLMINDTMSTVSFLPVIIGMGGFASFISGLIELKKISVEEKSGTTNRR